MCKPAEENLPSTQSQQYRQNKSAIKGPDREVSSSYMRRNATHITASISAYPKNDCSICIPPRASSCERINGGRVGRGSDVGTVELSAVQHPPSSETLSVDTIESRTRTKRAATIASDLFAIQPQHLGPNQAYLPLLPVLVHHTSHCSHTSLQDG